MPLFDTEAKKMLILFFQPSLVASLPHTKFEQEIPALKEGVIIFIEVKITAEYPEYPV